MTSVKYVAIPVAAFLLSGCLVSDAPLFDVATGSAEPLSVGRYQACSEPADEADCQIVAVVRLDDGAYEFLVEENDKIGVRFHAMGGAGFAAQLADDDGDGYQYYWAQREGETLSLTMLLCADLPERLRAAMIDEGLIASTEGDATCTALKAEAVVRAASAYRDGAAKADSILRLTPAP